MAETIRPVCYLNYGLRVLAKNMSPRSIVIAQSIKQFSAAYHDGSCMASTALGSAPRERGWKKGVAVYGWTVDGALDTMDGDGYE